MKCPRCRSENIIRNGSIHNGKQKYECRECKRQSVENPENKVICPETEALTDRLLYERIPSAGICRVTGVSGTWLRNYVNKKYGSVPEKVNVGNKKKAVLRYNAAEYGHLQEIGTINNGCGRQPMPAQKKLPDVMSAKETEAVRKGFGNQFRPYIVSVRYVTPISGHHMRKYFLRNGIALFGNRAEKQVISGGLIIR